MFDSVSHAPSPIVGLEDGGAENEDVPLHSSGTERRSRWAPFFTSALVFVGAVSAYDSYLVVRTGDMIQDFEKNPVGLYLIQIDNGNPSVFLRVKAAGTIVALTLLSFLHRRSERLASPVAFALFTFQMGLLIFLENPFS
jgi:hypothetical protein